MAERGLVPRALWDLPQEVAVWLQGLAEEIGACFGDHPEGVYLHGSLAMTGFCAASSDVDLLVAVESRPEAGEIACLRRLLLRRSGHPYDVELSVLARPDRHPWRHPSPFSWHYSELWRDAMAREEAGGPPAALPAVDEDLAAHFTMVRARGRRLCGLPIEAAFPEVPRQDFLDAVFTPDADRRFESVRAEPVDGVLNLCRIGLFAYEGSLASKLEGGLWAISRDAPGEHEVIHRALHGYRTGEPVSWTDEELRRFTRTWTRAIARRLRES
jgi:streptomycin 3"-adenylyltransferase